MGAVRGALVGGIGLVTLYNLVSAGNEGLLAATSIPGKIARYIVSPDVPLVPDLTASRSSSSSSSSAGSSAGPGGRLPTVSGSIDKPNPLSLFGGGGPLSGVVAPGTLDNKP